MTTSIDALSPIDFLKPKAGVDAAVELGQTRYAFEPSQPSEAVGAFWTVTRQWGSTGPYRSQDSSMLRPRPPALEPAPPPYRQWGSHSLDIVIADRQQIVRAALAALVSKMDGMRVVADASNASELLGLLETLHPDVVVADLALPGAGGCAAIQQVRERHPQVPVLAVSSDDTRATVQRVASVGASGYISQCSTPEDLELALRNMVASGAHLPARAVLHLLSDEPPPDEGDPLTPRQRQIATMFAQGKSAKQIAFDLGLSVRTVDVHRARIFHRLHVHSLAELTRDALRRGLIDP